MSGLQLVSYTINGDLDFLFDRCLIEFEKRELAIYSGSRTECDTVETIIDDEKEFDGAYETVSRFLLILAWEARSGVEITGVSTKSLQERIRLPLKRPFTSSPRMFPRRAHIWSLRIPQTKEANMALSLYSEATHSRSPFQTLLCYWRILEIEFPGRTEHAAGKWINNAIKQKFNIYLTDEVKEMIAKGTNVGDYFAGVRNSIAHTRRPPMRFPYKWSDRLRVIEAASALKSFVDYFIENEVGLPKYAQSINVKHIVNPSESPLYFTLPSGISASIDAPPDAGSRIRALRQALGISQLRLAQFAQTSRRMISQIERGVKPRDVTILPRVARELGTRLTQLNLSSNR